MPKASLVVILTEDLRTQRFVVRFLSKLNYKPHHYRKIISPRGSGEQFVRQRYAEQLLALRARQAQTILIVVIDADMQTVDQRLQQLRSALQERSVREPGQDELVVLLVPRRNIETWICNLTGSKVDEATNYKPRSGSQQDRLIDEALTPAAERFYETTRPGAGQPDDLVDSLKRAIPEARRVPAFRSH